MAKFKNRRESDETDEESAANDRDIDKLDKVERESKKDDPPPEEPEEKDEDVFVIGGDKDDDDDGDEDRPSRQQRRRQRGDNILRQERERAERAEAEIQRLAREAAEQRALLAGYMQRQAPQSQEDPQKQRLAQLEEEASGIRGRYEAVTQRYRQLEAEGKLDEASARALRTEAAKLHDALAKNQYDRFAPQQQQSLTPAQVSEMNLRQRMTDEHGDVLQKPGGFAFFNGHYQRLVDQGHQKGWATVGMAMEAARKDVGLQPKGGRPAPSAGTQRKFSGTRAGGTGAGHQSERVVMTKELKEMADGMYSHEKDPKKRYQRYVNEVASKPGFGKPKKAAV